MKRLWRRWREHRAEKRRERRAMDEIYGRIDEELDEREGNTRL